jgi:hypothetical protein
MNFPSKIASNWFGDKERAIASSIGALSVSVGLIMSYTMPQFIFLNDYSKNFQQGRQDFCLFLMI